MYTTAPPALRYCFHHWSLGMARCLSCCQMEDSLAVSDYYMSDAVVAAADDASVSGWQDGEDDPLIVAWVTVHHVHDSLNCVEFFTNTMISPLPSVPYAFIVGKNFPSERTVARMVVICFVRMVVICWKIRFYSSWIFFTQSLIFCFSHSLKSCL